MQDRAVSIIVWHFSSSLLWLLWVFNEFKCPNNGKISTVSNLKLALLHSQTHAYHPKLIWRTRYGIHSKWKKYIRLIQIQWIRNNWPAFCVPMHRYLLSECTADVRGTKKIIEQRVWRICSLRLFGWILFVFVVLRSEAECIWLVHLPVVFLLISGSICLVFVYFADFCLFPVYFLVFPCLIRFFHTKNRFSNLWSFQL